MITNQTIDLFCTISINLCTDYYCDYEFSLTINVCAALIPCMGILFQALAWTLSHPSGIIPLIGTTNNTRVNSLVGAVELSQRFTSSLWWKIGSAGGLCALGDSQCNYDQYRAV